MALTLRIEMLGEHDRSREIRRQRAYQSRKRAYTSRRRTYYYEIVILFGLF
jgi:hypothetical protein